MNTAQQAKQKISLTVPAKLLADFEETCVKDFRTRGQTLISLMEVYVEKAPAKGFFRTVEDRIKAVI